jgi:hypothetical protein
LYPGIQFFQDAPLGLAHGTLGYESTIRQRPGALALIAPQEKKFDDR